MKISEELFLMSTLLNTTRLKRGLLLPSLLPVSYIEDVFEEAIIYIRHVGHKNKLNDWSYNKTKTANIIKVDDRPVRHKVYHLPELEFMREYLGEESINFDLLMELSGDHDRASFVVNEDIFIETLKDMSTVIMNYKYSHLWRCGRNLNGRRDRKLNPVITITKASEVLPNYYSGPVEGYIVSFELLHLLHDLYVPRVYMPVHILLTNQYEGIFYFDGKNKIKEETPDLNYILKLVTASIHVQEDSKEKPNGGKSWTEFGTTVDFDTALEYAKAYEVEYKSKKNSKLFTNKTSYAVDFETALEEDLQRPDSVGKDFLNEQRIKLGGKSRRGDGLNDEERIKAAAFKTRNLDAAGTANTTKTFSNTNIPQEALQDIPIQDIPPEVLEFYKEKHKREYLRSDRNEQYTNSKAEHRQYDDPWTGYSRAGVKTGRRSSINSETKVKAKSTKPKTKTTSEYSSFMSQLRSTTSTT